ncbi:hypothetical protein [Nocardia sp. NPDC024068]|uniref:hypothetical protein n=1 Tax=Nocardia sp. NPDC024068 TaxID=3157197 RepID=UPI0033DF39BB
MFDWLAAEADTVPSGSAWKDVLTVGAPLAVVLAAWIVGRYASGLARATPYERLDGLVKVRAAWPEGLEGRDSLDRSVAYTLAQIRQLEGDTTHLDTSPNARWADYHVALAYRRSVYLRAAFGSVALAVVAALCAWRVPAWLDILARQGRREVLRTVYPLSVLLLGAVVVIAISLWELHRLRQHTDLAAFPQRAQPVVTARGNKGAERRPDVPEPAHPGITGPAS